MIDTLGIAVTVATLGGLGTFVYFRTLRAGNKSLIARRLKPGNELGGNWADGDWPHLPQVFPVNKYRGRQHNAGGDERADSPGYVLVIDTHDRNGNAP